MAEGIRRKKLASGGVTYIVTGYDPVKGGGSREVGRARSLDEAKRIKREFEDAKRNRRAGDVTCDEWAERWLEESAPGRDWSATTVAHYKWCADGFKKDFAGVKLSEVTRPLAAAWAHGGVVGRELEPFVKRWQGAERLRSGQWRVPGHKWHAKSVRTMFTDAMLKGLIDSNPWVGLRLEGTRGRKDAVMLSVAELRVLVAKAKAAQPGYPYFAAMIVAAAYTGMRPGELYALQWEDLDFTRGEVTVRHQYRSKTRDISAPKNKQTRTIVLPDQAAEELLRLPLPHEGTVFLTKRGKPFSGRVHHYYWDPVRAAFGRPEMEFYELRHMAASYLADLGATAQQIAHQLGHTDNGALAMKLYIHTYEESTRDALRSLFRKGDERDRQRPADDDAAESA